MITLCRQEVPTINKLILNFEVMLVTHNPTSWIRHVVCEVGSKKMRHEVTHDSTFLREVLLLKSSYRIYHMK